LLQVQQAGNANPSVQSGRQQQGALNEQLIHNNSEWQLNTRLPLMTGQKSEARIGLPPKLKPN